jgi:Fic family protein
LGRAIDGAQTILGAVLAKAHFWESIQGVALNKRQTLVLNRLLDGLEGKLTTSKYAKLAKCSQDGRRAKTVSAQVHNSCSARLPGFG